MVLLMPTMCLIRVVNGKHTSCTKGNREWQEKLPIVVFKAEEIMYSKANSEVICVVCVVLEAFCGCVFAEFWVG